MFNNIYKGKTVLVTGHTGFKGSWLSLWLRQLGANVIGYSLYVPSVPSQYELIPKSYFQHEVIGDIRDFELLKSTIDKHNPEFVFHLAAMPIVSECYDKPMDAFATNALGTVNVLEAIRKNGNVKVAVMITSDKCYENVEWLYGYRENDQLGGIDPYSASKACAEIAISSYIRSYFKGTQAKVASVRAGNVIGGGDWANNRIIPDAVRAYHKKESLSVRSPESTRPWQLVLEPLSGYLWLGALMQQGKESVIGEAFNFGPKFQEDYTVRQVIEEMQKHLTLGSEFSAQNFIKKEANLLKLNCDKARSLLQWSGTLDFRQTIEFTSKWYREYYEGDKSKIVDYSHQQISEYAKLARSQQLLWALE